MLPGALENYAAAQGEAVHALQLIPHFLDRPQRADEGGWHSGVVLEALHVLLSLEALHVLLSQRYYLGEALPRYELNAHFSFNGAGCISAIRVLLVFVSPQKDHKCCTLDAEIDMFLV